MNKNYFRYLLGISALVILLVSAYFSIRGISQLFSGQKYIAMLLAGSLEFAKIVVTTYLTKYWFNTNKLIKFYFLIATIILILISSAGIFANLTDAYQITSIKNNAFELEENKIKLEENNLNSKKNTLNNELSKANDDISFIQNSIKRNDDQISKLYKQMEEDSTANWIGSIWDFKKQNKEYKIELEKLRKNKNSIINEINYTDSLLINVSLNKINSINDNKDKINNIGPLKKLSELFDINTDKMVKYFIFVIILVFDPLGVLLVVSFTYLGMINKEENNNNKNIDEKYIKLNKEDDIKKINLKNESNTGTYFNDLIEFENKYNGFDNENNNNSTEWNKEWINIFEDDGNNTDVEKESLVEIPIIDKKIKLNFKNPIKLELENKENFNELEKDYIEMNENLSQGTSPELLEFEDNKIKENEITVQDNIYEENVIEKTDKNSIINKNNNLNKKVIKERAHIVKTKRSRG